MHRAQSSVQSVFSLIAAAIAAERKAERGEIGWVVKTVRTKGTKSTLEYKVEFLTGEEAAKRARKERKRDGRPYHQVRSVAGKSSLAS